MSLWTDKTNLEWDGLHWLSLSRTRPVCVSGDSFKEAGEQPADSLIWRISTTREESKSRTTLGPFSCFLFFLHPQKNCKKSWHSLRRTWAATSAAIFWWKKIFKAPSHVPSMVLPNLVFVVLYTLTVQLPLSTLPVNKTSCNTLPVLRNQYEDHDNLLYVWMCVCVFIVYPGVLFVLVLFLLQKCLNWQFKLIQLYFKMWNYPLHKNIQPLKL